MSKNDFKTKSDYSCGVVPLRVVGGTREFLLVQHNAGHWAFPKGHPEVDETPLDTARREMREETGLAHVQLLEAPAFEEAYSFTKRSGTVIEKTVTYYLGQLPDSAGEVVVQEEEVQAFAWGDAEATMQKISFDEGRRLFDEVLSYLDASSEPFGL